MTIVVEIVEIEIVEIEIVEMMIRIVVGTTTIVVLRDRDRSGRES